MKRLELFNGKYTMPRINDMQSKDPRAYAELQKMFTAMWNTYLAKGATGTISLPYWAKRVKSPKLMNIALAMLSEAGYITVSTQPNRNWSEASLSEAKLLSYVTVEELASIRKQFKWNKYLLTQSDVNPSCANLTRMNGVTSNTGLSRPGFAKTAQTNFQFDTLTMQNHYEGVIALINKGIEETLTKYPSLRDDLANYGEVGKEVVDTYIYNDGTYNSGNRVSDSRGRNIAGYLNKIGNPVGYKVMRSLLVIPEENRQIATNKGLAAKYLFIAELVGYRSGTIEGKLAFGKECYKKRTLPNPEDLEELPEYIWLDRLYKDVDGYYERGWSEYYWTVPVEADASASILSYFGLLLGHRPYLDRCNVIVEDGKLNDAWTHDTIKVRDQVKSAMRLLYGSQQSPADMWTTMKLKYTTEELVAFAESINEGEFKVANDMKDFIINNAQMQPTMKLNVWGEEFTVNCNKFHNRGETTISFDLFDSATGGIRRIHHTDTIRVPDLHAFKRYTVTALIHHIDSRVMDFTCNAVYDKYAWAIDIHDAIIVDCEAVGYAREQYANMINNVYSDRKSILQNYFRSINIPASKQGEWKEVMSKVEPVEDTFKCSPMVLK